LFFISLVILPSFSGEVFSNSEVLDDPPHIIWSKVYESNGQALSVEQTSDGGYILGGISGEDATLIKTDTNGTAEWIKHTGGDHDDGAYDVIECSDGGFLITGFDGYTPIHGMKETFLIKTDSDGDELWKKTFRKYDRGEGSCWGTSVIEISDGYVILSILSYESKEEQGTTWLIKTDKDGNELWNRTHGGGPGGLGDDGYDLIQSKDGGFVITGTAYTFDIGGGDAWLLKTDSEGNKLWSKSYGGYSRDWGEKVIQTDDGGFVIAGKFTPAHQSWGDVCIIKTDCSGNQEWIRHYGGTDNDFGTSVVKTDDGGYVVAGVRHSDLPHFTGWLLKTDGNGNKLWDKVIGGSYANDVIKSNDGNYVVAGLNGGVWLGKIEDFENNPPGKPTYQYDENWQQLKVVAMDPDGDRIRYGISWYNNKVVDEWTGYYDSGEEDAINCFGKDKPAYVIAEDEHGGQSEWVMAKPINPFIRLFNWLLNRFPILEELFKIYCFGF